MFELRKKYHIGWRMQLSLIDKQRCQESLIEHEEKINRTLYKLRNAGHAILGITSVASGRNRDTEMVLQNYGGKRVQNHYCISTTIFHEIAEHAKICKKCGTPNLTNAKFCSQCGADIGLKP